jgi:hypothetical protein
MIQLLDERGRKGRSGCRRRRREEERREEEDSGGVM